MNFFLLCMEIIVLLILGISQYSVKIQRVFSFLHIIIFNEMATLPSIFSSGIQFKSLSSSVLSE